VYGGGGFTTLQDPISTYNQYRLGHYSNMPANEPLYCKQQAISLDPDLGYFFWERRPYWSRFPNFRYLTPELQKQDFNWCHAQPWQRCPRSGERFLQLLPERQADLEQIAQSPGGGNGCWCRRQQNCGNSNFAYILTRSSLHVAPPRSIN